MTVLGLAVLDADVDVALTVGLIGELVRAIDHPSRDPLHVLPLDTLEDDLDAQPSSARG